MKGLSQHLAQEEQKMMKKRKDSSATMAIS